MMSKEHLLLAFDRLPGPIKAVIIVSFLSASVYLMYSVTIKQYTTNYFSLKNQLQTQEKLLSSKLTKTKAIKRLEKVKHEYDSIIADINNNFFTEEESDLFVKSLPQIIASFGNEVSSMIPSRRSNSKRRAAMLNKYITELNDKRTAKKAFDYVKLWEAEINAGKNKKKHIRDISKIVRKSKTDLKRAWGQGVDDPLAELFMEKVLIDLTFKGSYKGIVQLFEWLNEREKQMDIQDINMEASFDNRDLVSVKMKMSFYIITEELQ